MNRQAKLFISAVVLSGLVVLGISLRQWHSDDPLRFVTLLALAVFSSSFKLRIPGIEGTYSANFVFILIGICSLGLAETMVIACIGGIVQTVWKAKCPPAVIQMAFNTAALAISTLIAYAIPHLAFGQSGMLILPAFAATLYFIVNTVLVSGVVCRLSNQSFKDTWKAWHLWSFPYYFGGAVVAGIVIFSEQKLEWPIPWVMLPLIYLVYAYCNVRSLADRNDGVGH
jgi:hypothetical protein